MRYLTTLTNASNKQTRAAQELCKKKIELKQGRQCTYNVTVKRVRVTIVAAEKQ